MNASINVRKKKLEFLISTFPNIKNVDPFLDYGFIIDCKIALSKAGFYKGALSSINDSTIINLIREIKFSKCERLHGVYKNFEQRKQNY